MDIAMSWKLSLSSTSILEAETLGIMNMSKGMEFSPQASTEKRYELQELLEQALRPPISTPITAPNQMPMSQAWPITRVYTLPIPLAFVAGSSTPQKPPGSLDQDSERTRPVTPEPLISRIHQPPVDAIPHKAGLERQPSTKSQCPLARDEALFLYEHT